MAGTLSEPRQRAPLFHKQKTAALRVMAAFFERPSTNRRPLLAGAKYKRNRPGMIEIFYVNQVGDFYAKHRVPLHAIESAGKYRDRLEIIARNKGEKWHKD